MASSSDHISMALFCDFENVALGVRDANYDKFDIKRVLERLLLKGSIVVKKAYCDWERYKGFKATMHEANFELIEIPHVRQSGKNSADIRLVVDALDLCYTKSHVNTFVIISGDSDFSPLVSKLRENAKHVIGVGVKQSTSDLLIANCDEFIFYDDLVRESQRADARRNPRDASQPAQRRTPEEDRRRKEEMDARRSKAVEMAVETYEALVTDRDEGGKIWASVLKEAIKRRSPGFNENYYGFRTFGNLLEEARSRGLLEFGRDEKSSAFVYRSLASTAGSDGLPAPMPSAQAQDVSQLSERDFGAEADADAQADTDTTASAHEPKAASDEQRSEGRRRGRGGRGGRGGNPDRDRDGGRTGQRDRQGQRAASGEAMAPTQGGRPEQQATPAPAPAASPAPATVPAPRAAAETSAAPVAHTPAPSAPEGKPHGRAPAAKRTSAPRKTTAKQAGSANANANAPAPTPAATAAPASAAAPKAEAAPSAGKRPRAKASSTVPSASVAHSDDAPAQRKSPARRPRKAADDAA